MRRAAQVIFVAAISGIFGLGILEGIDREISRLEARTEAMCKDYGAAMNNWARQENLQPPCEE